MRCPEDVGDHWQQLTLSWFGKTATGTAGALVSIMLISEESNPKQAMYRASIGFQATLTRGDASLVSNKMVECSKLLLCTLYINDQYMVYRVSNTRTEPSAPTDTNVSDRFGEKQTSKTSLS